MAQTKPKAGQFYGVSDNGTDGQFLKTDGTGGMSWDSPITNPTITSIDYPGTQTAADPAGGESVIINGTLFASGITCTVGGTSAVTAFNSATQITITTPAKAAGQYAVAVTNSDGGTASQANFIQYSGVPVWSTASGSLGNVQEGEAASFQVTATEGSDTIEYAVTTGTLPTGLSLATATGAITGTAPAVSADTTTTFSITATDDENQTSSERSFSITVQNDLPSNHFDTVLYSGNGGTQSITGLNFSPGLVWIKKRNTTEDHAWFDTVRGTQQQISSNLTSADYTTTNALSSFNSDGFTTGNNGATNNGSGTYVAWNFKAGGAAVANTDGTINSQVSANNTLGFSIVSYSGNSASSATIGHGLNSAPELVIIKARNFAAGWPTLAAPSGTIVYTRRLNDTGATDPAYGSVFFNSTAPTSSIFTVGGSDEVNDAYNYIAYCFTSKPGFSKVGSYTGNGSASGPMVQTGFEPAFLMIKRTDGTAGNWFIFDNERSTTNERDDFLHPNLNAAETTNSAAYSVDFLSNGFQIKGNGDQINGNNGTHIYLAIAADGSTATPSLANSFAPEIYTGNGGTQAITTGFKPDLVWIKGRSVATSNNIFDSIRGNKRIVTNSTNAEVDLNPYAPYGITSFNSNGFTVGDNYNGDYGLNGDPSGTYGSSQGYVSWNWKAGGTPSINTDGTITSIVSANQAAGFSVVKYTGNNVAGATIGHGLGVEPDMIILKNLSTTDSWTVQTSDLTYTDYIDLNSTNAATTNSSVWYAQPTSNVFSFGANPRGNGSGNSIIAYCFKSISGYSKVGTYTSTYPSTTSINVGFQPSFVMIKSYNQARNWVIHDSARGDQYQLYPNLSNAEGNTGTDLQFTSTGFNVSGGGNDLDGGSSYSYIYLAIKEN